MFQPEINCKTVPFSGKKCVIWKLIMYSKIYSFYFFIFVHEEVEQKTQRCYTENEIFSMVEFLLDYLFVEFRVHLFQQIIDQHPQRNNMCPFPCISLSLLMRQSLFKDRLLPNRDRLFSIIIFHTTYTKTISDRLFRFDNNQCSFPETSSSSEKQTKVLHRKWNPQHVGVPFGLPICRVQSAFISTNHWSTSPKEQYVPLSLYIFVFLY
jgi:hypothetical protein